MLGKLSPTSSVSGGSITAGVLGLKWGSLAFGADRRGREIRAEVVRPIRALAGKTIDGRILSGVLLPGRSPTRWPSAIASICSATRRCRPCRTAPGLVINATSVQTGALFGSPGRTWPTIESAWCEPDGRTRPGGCGLVGISAGAVPAHLEFDPRCRTPSGGRPRICIASRS